MIPRNSGFKECLWSNKKTPGWFEKYKSIVQRVSTDCVAKRPRKAYARPDQFCWSGTRSASSMFATSSRPTCDYARAVCFKTVNDKRTATTARELSSAYVRKHNGKAQRPQHPFHPTTEHDNNIMPPVRVYIHTYTRTAPETRVGKVVLRTDGRTTPTLRRHTPPPAPSPTCFFGVCVDPFLKYYSYSPRRPHADLVRRTSCRPPRRQFSADGFPRTRARTISTFHYIQTAHCFVSLAPTFPPPSQPRLYYYYFSLKINIFFFFEFIGLVYLWRRRRRLPQNTLWFCFLFFCFFFNIYLIYCILEDCCAFYFFNIFFF